MDEALAESKGIKVSTKNGKTTIQGDGFGNTITVETDKNGGLLITGDNGFTYRIAPCNNNVLIIRGGGGDDTIKISDDVKRTVQIYGDDGDDTLYGGGGRNTIQGGDGKDYIEGGGRADQLAGGDGRDVIYGLDGTDDISGGGDDDYIDGGGGNDTLQGDIGDDIVSGGLGDDLLTDGEGNDVMITAGGFDRVSDPSGGDADLVYGDQMDTIDRNPFTPLANGTSVVMVTPYANPNGSPLGSSILIEGSSRFTMRVQSDLDTYRGLPLGQTMLQSLDSSGQKTTIKPGESDGTLADPEDDVWDAMIADDGAPGEHVDTTISYNPALRQIKDGTQAWENIPPAVALFHEMGHAEDMTHGTQIHPTHTSPNTDGTQTSWGKPRNSELSVTGLPYDQNGDKINDPNTRVTTENNMRIALGLDLRPHYN